MTRDIRIAANPHAYAKIYCVSSSWCNMHKEAEKVHNSIALC